MNINSRSLKTKDLPTLAIKYIVRNIPADLRKKIVNNPSGRKLITLWSRFIKPPSKIGFIIADNAGSLKAVINIPNIANTNGVVLSFKAILISLL